MAGLDLMTAAPITCRIGETDLLLSPIRLSDAGELLAYFRQKRLQECRETLEGLGSAVPDAMRETMLLRAMEEAKRITLTSLMAKVKAEDLIEGVEVLMRMVFYSARRNMPGLTLDNIRDICTVDKMPEFTGALDAVHQVQVAAGADQDGDSGEA